jgi:hypothetical protein
MHEKCRVVLLVETTPDMLSRWPDIRQHYLPLLLDALHPDSDSDGGVSELRRLSRDLFSWIGMFLFLAWYFLARIGDHHYPGRAVNGKPRSTHL